MPSMDYFVIMGTIDLSFLIFSILLLFLQLLFTIGVEIPDLEGDKLGVKLHGLYLKAVNLALILWHYLDLC